MARKPLVWGIMAGLIVVFALFQAARHMIRTDPQKARLLNTAMPVETAPARVAPIEEIIGAGGEVQPIATVTLTARISGRILQVPVDLGSIVKEGDQLIQWDDRLFQAALNTAREGVEKSQTQLDHGVRQLERLTSLETQGMGSAFDVEEARVGVATARMEQAMAQEAMTRAQWDMENTSLRSPVTGVVLERAVNPGESTKADQPLLTLGALDHILMVAHVGEEKIGSIHLGQTAEVTYDAYPTKRFSGWVVTIDPKIDPKTRTFSTYVKLANPDLRLKPGMTGFVRIRWQKAALAVPSIAVVNSVGDRPTVFAVGRDLRVHLREIKPGRVAQNQTEILEGLNEGDVVVTIGQFHLKENDLVRSESLRAEK
ncbi:MAG: efflux RND transporter periplasmic adaptor subunit [Nitrospirota bacterium]